MTTLLDKTRPVRAGEEVDLEKLFAFLRGAGVVGPNAKLEISQFPGGHSNLTYLLEVHEVTETRQYVLRRPPAGAKIATAHDMGREFRILSKLSKVWSRAPEPVASCDDASVIGAPFYVMKRIAGVVLRRALPDGLVLGPERADALCENFVRTLAELHRLDYEAAGLGDLGKPEGYVERQVTGWTKRYAAAKTDEIADVDDIAKWLAARVPATTRGCLIHNDFKFDNCVLGLDDPTNVVGVLDWEMSTLGDPLSDLGVSLGYWVSPTDPDELKMFAFGPTYLPGMWTRRQLVDRYAQLTGEDPGDMVFPLAFALFKTAVVAQQIYARYVAGHSKDERFAAMIHGVRMLSRRAVEVAERGSID